MALKTKRTTLDCVANNLRSLLKMRGMNQSDLARAAGVSFDLVSNTINAEHMPQLPGLLAIARALGVTLDDLVSQSRLVDRLPRP